jgi:hypothetical protein
LSRSSARRRCFEDGPARSTLLLPGAERPHQSTTAAKPCNRCHIER